MGIKFDRDGGWSGNWHDVVRESQTETGPVGTATLTLEGKVLIMKVVILPLLLLMCSVFNPPRFFRLALDRAIFTFCGDRGGRGSGET